MISLLLFIWWRLVTSPQWSWIDEIDCILRPWPISLTVISKWFQTDEVISNGLPLVFNFAIWSPIQKLIHFSFISTILIKKSYSYSEGYPPIKWIYFCKMAEYFLFRIYAWFKYPQGIHLSCVLVFFFQRSVFNFRSSLRPWSRRLSQCCIRRVRCTANRALLVHWRQHCSHLFYSDLESSNFAEIASSLPPPPTSAGSFFTSSFQALRRMAPPLLLRVHRSTRRITWQVFIRQLTKKN